VSKGSRTVRNQLPDADLWRRRIEPGRLGRRSQTPRRRGLEWFPTRRGRRDRPGVDARERACRLKIEKVEGLLIGSDLIGTNFVVRITTDSGLTGIGQSGAWGFPDAAEAVVDQFREYLIGQDPFRIDHIQQSLYRMRPFRGNILSGALSAIDIALWDIKGKHFGAPIWELLGGKFRDKVRLHLLLPLQSDSPEQVFKSSREAAEQGFTAIKLDPLRAGYADQTLSRLIESAREIAAAAREGAGLDVDLIFEIHRKLTPMNAVALADALVEFRPLFYEDPIQIDSMVLQAQIAKRTVLPVANGERMSTIWEYRDLLEAGGPQYVRPDLGIAGGITGCRKIAALAESYHSALVSHNFLGPLLTAASIHLDVAIPNFVTQEYLMLDESPRPADAIFKSVLKREGGYILAPEAPGLGVELDDALLDQTPFQYLPRRVSLRVDGSPAFAV
jgi:galactonate dehydratase